MREILQLQHMENTKSNNTGIKFQWWWAVLAVLALLAIWAVASYNGLVSARNEVSNARGNLQSAYQRRSDLVPNLVNTVRGAANFEQTTLTQVVEARAKATSVTLNADNLQQFNQAQGELSSALSRLLAVSEAYPQLTATQNFRDLQVELSGTENRINTARRDFNAVVTNYNNRIQTFPTNISAGLFGFRSEAVFQASDNAQSAPSVNF